MKNLLVAISMLFCVGGVDAQITLEHKYDTGSVIGYYVRMVHFSAHGYKYVMVNPHRLHGMIEIYNLNHSLYEQFSIPPQPTASTSSANSLLVEYISDSLFNTNPTDIEYIVMFTDTSGDFPHLRIYNDAGSTIFSRDSVSLSNTFGPGSYTEPVFYTPNGYKIRMDGNELSNPYAPAYIYALPGALPCGECANGNEISTPAPNVPENNGSLLNAYPNPAKNSTTIKYELPNGANQGEIIFYDLQGRQVKSFTVDRTFDSLLVFTTDMAAGTYFYILRANGNYVGSKKMVIIK